jgi:hypothetical protein
MSERRVTTFRLDPELLQGLQDVWQRDGVQPSEQVRRAIRAWLTEKGVLGKPGRKQTRKRPE